MNAIKANKALCKDTYCRTRTLYTMKDQAERGHQIYNKATFEGACLDSGSQQSVIGHAQACAYHNSTGRQVRPVNDPLLFTFGDVERPSVFILDAGIPVPNGLHISVRVHVLKYDIPKLIGMEVLGAERLVLDFYRRTISCNDG